MKYLRGFGQFIKESSRLTQLGLLGLNDEQKEFLDECTEGSWDFDPKTGLVNIDGSFGCHDMQLTDFKGINFGKVGVNFRCERNYLTNLLGSPQEVVGNFWCEHNQLISLEGAPEKVNDSFNCTSNQLTSLEGAPQWVGGSFYCYDNNLISLKGAPQKVGYHFYCYNNPNLQSLAGLPKLTSVHIPGHLEERLEQIRAEAKKLKSNKLESEE